MPTPKKKTSRSRRDMRRSHDGLSAPAVAIDKKTGELAGLLFGHKCLVALVNVFMRAVEIIKGVIVPAKNNSQAIATVCIGLPGADLVKDLPGFKVIEDLKRFKSFFGLCRLQGHVTQQKNKKQPYSHM